MRPHRPPGKAGPLRLDGARPFARQDNLRQDSARKDHSTRTETKVIRRFFHLIERLEQAEHQRGGFAPAGAERKSQAPQARITRLEP